MSKPSTVAIALSSLVLPAGTSPAAAPLPTARFADGVVAGSTSGEVTTFLGIPYAAPPVDDLRWAAPAPVQAWAGVRPAKAFAPACAQTAAWITERKSEDCLYLNIWTPAKPGRGKLPVMVWIHGGGFYGGSGSQPAYDGARLTRRGVIVVTLNYRLGVFGFFAHPELTRRDHVTGNQGLLDQVAALRWVQRNIAAVGGDPDRVTIMGESAGGESVAVLTTSPLASGLFQRAIAESGNYGVPLNRAEVPDYARETAEAAGSALGETLGRASLAELRRVPVQALLEQSWSPRTNLDGNLIRNDMTAIYEDGLPNPVPLLLGWNANEGVDLAPEILMTDQLTTVNYNRLIEKLLRRKPTPAFRTIYPARDDGEAHASLERFVTDWWGWRMWSWAGLHRRYAPSPSYLYYFVHWPAAPATGCSYGCRAGHGAEIRYVFDQLDQDSRLWTAADRMLADEIATYWTNFAKTGNPNGTTVPHWRAYNGNEASVRRLGDTEEAKQRGNLPRFEVMSYTGP